MRARPSTFLVLTLLAIGLAGGLGAPPLEPPTAPVGRMARPAHFTGATNPLPPPTPDEWSSDLPVVAPTEGPSDAAVSPPTWWERFAGWKQTCHDGMENEEAVVDRVEESLEHRESPAAEAWIAAQRADLARRAERPDPSDSLCEALVGVRLIQRSALGVVCPDGRRAVITYLPSRRQAQTLCGLDAPVHLSFRESDMLVRL